MKPETEIVARACPMFVPLVGENGYVNDETPSSSSSSPSICRR